MSEEFNNEELNSEESIHSEENSSAETGEEIHAEEMNGSVNPEYAETNNETTGTAYAEPQPETGYAAGSEQQTIDETTASKYEKKAEKKKKKASGSKGLGVRIVALALVCALVGGFAGAGGMYLITRGNASSTGSETASGTQASAKKQNETVVYEATRDTATISTTSVVTGETYTPAQVYAMNVGSTVGITTSIVTNYWGYTSTSAASGSGFIITADGYILTNYHVIEDSSSVTVTTYDGSSYDATVIGYDENNDIAVLKIDAEGLTPVVLGDSDALSVGDEVAAIGNPLGELTFSLTEGVVSALNRAVTVSTGVTMNLIQTDCAINSGNSGGALFNMYGEVIGITNAKYSSSSSSSTASIDNIGFAIPINSVKDIVTSIIEKGYFSKPYIGVSVSSVGSESQAYGLPAGAAVRSVTEGSPAEEAGLQVNDIITAVNGEEITSSSELVDLIGDCNIGDVITLTVYRQNETVTLTLTVGESIQSALPETTDSSSSSSSSDGSSDSGTQGSQSDPYGGMFGNGSGSGSYGGFGGGYGGFGGGFGG